MQLAEQPSRQHRRQDRQPGVATGNRYAECAHRPKQHHPLDPQVEHAGTLGKDLAQCRKQQHRAAGNPGLEDDDWIHLHFLDKMTTSFEF